MKPSLLSLAGLALIAVAATACGSTTTSGTQETSSDVQSAPTAPSSAAAHPSAPADQSTAAAAVASSPPAAAASKSSAAGNTTPECRNQDVKVSFRALDNGAGHRSGEVLLKNVSDHPCRTGGFGGLSYTADNGAQIGASATRAGKGTPILLEPAQTAASRIQETNTEMYDTSECQPRKVYGLRVYIPNETRWQDVAHTTTGCANRKIDLIQQQPLRVQ